MYIEPITTTITADSPIEVDVQPVDIERRNKLLHTIFHLCELAGFVLEGRINLYDKRTGKHWN